MSEQDRQRWQRRHTEPRDASPRPTIRWVGRGGGALALDVACGQGRHTLALLELGYRVVAVDIARTALERLDRLLPRAARAFLVEADLDTWPFADEAFDLIVMFDFLDRTLLQRLRSSVKPGGLLLIDTFLHDRSGGARSGPSNPRYLLEPGELDRLFADWTILERERFEREGMRDAILARRPVAGTRPKTPS